MAAGADRGSDRAPSPSAALHCVDLVDYPPPAIDSQQVEVVSVARAGIILDDFHRGGVAGDVDRSDAQIALLLLTGTLREHGVPAPLRQLVDLPIGPDGEQTRVGPKGIVKADSVVEFESMQIALDDGTDRR